MDLRRKALLRGFQLTDLTILFIWFLVVVSILSPNHDGSFFGVLSLEISLMNLLFFIFYLIVCNKIFEGFKLYHSKRLSTLVLEIIHVLGAFSLCSVCLGVTAFYLGLGLLDWKFTFLYWAGSCCIAVLSRIVLRSTLKWMRLRGRNLRNFLIIGTNEQAIQFARNIESMPEIGYRLSGFVDEDWVGSRAFNKTGNEIVSDFKGFRSYLRDNVIDDVAIFLPIKSYYSQVSKILNICEEQGVVYRNRAKLFESKSTHSEFTTFAGKNLTTHYTGAMNGWLLTVKRFIDIVLSAMGLLALSPLFAVVMVLVRVTSNGPAFFVQNRLGYHKRIFQLYKFRTMVNDAEAKQAEIEDLNEAEGPVFKIKNDPRITAVGKFLRKTSIDELPQLINVLKGDMSIVGPRPLPIRDYEGFEEDWQRRRFSVKPGITCLWQVNGRSSISFDQWMELDMNYIDRWSLFLDIKILLRTIPAVLKGAGAE